MPARFGDIVRALRKSGAMVQKPKTGSHWKAVAPDGRTYPIPASHGTKTKIPDVYIRGVCRALGLDESEFRKLL